MRDVLIGTTDYTVLVKINAVAGSPLTGLTNTDIDIAYTRVETDNDVVVTDVAPASLTALTDAHTDWGFKEVSSTDAPGLYRLDIADAVFASGAWESVVTITDASGTDFYATDVGFRLVAFNSLDGVRLGLTALPNAAADAAGGLPISDAGGLDLDAKIGALTFTVANKVDANATHINSVATTSVTTVSAHVGTTAANTMLDAASVRSAVGLASANLDTQLDALPTGAENATAVWGKTLETGFDATRIFRIIAAATAGKVTGEPGSPVFRDLQDANDMITGTADANGNRSAATYGS